MNRRKPGKEDKPVRILQGAAFMALVIGAAGITDPDGEIQPVAVVLLGIALVGLLIVSRAERRS